MGIQLQESGHETGQSFSDYATEAAKHGDNPRDYSGDEQDFVFVSPGYAASDPSWDKPEDWPDDLPLWEYRPNG